MRISLAIALIVTVIAEMVAGNSGIGFYILSAQRSFLIPEMYAGVIALALLGFALNKGFVAMERHALAWHEGWNAAAA
jgi:ABC-type nitrate/sulfonate/bicarbonate transport system permease component